MPLLLPDRNNAILNAHLLLQLCLGTQGLQRTPSAYLASEKHRRDPQLSAADGGHLPRGKGVKENILHFLLDLKDVFPIPTLTPKSRASSIPMRLFSSILIYLEREDTQF